MNSAGSYKTMLAGKDLLTPYGLSGAKRIDQLRVFFIVREGHNKPK